MATDQPDGYGVSTVTVRQFLTSEWPAYRELRLAALADAPDAFGGTYAESAGRTDACWRARLAHAAPECDLPLLVEHDGRAAGLAWGRIEPNERSVAHVYQMWVAPEHRGAGAGRMLLNAIVSWASGKGAGTVMLSVTRGNSAAWRLYTSAGFKPAGEPEPLRPGSDLKAQPMRLELASASARGRRPCRPA